MASTPRRCSTRIGLAPSARNLIYVAASGCLPRTGERSSSVDGGRRNRAWRRIGGPRDRCLRDLGKAQRHAGQRNLLRLVAGTDGFRPGLKLSVAADILYAIGSPETYQLIVVDRGWSGAQFERWYAEKIERLLFDLPGQRPDLGRNRRGPRSVPPA